MAIGTKGVIAIAAAGFIAGFATAKMISSRPSAVVTTSSTAGQAETLQTTPDQAELPAGKNPIADFEALGAESAAPQAATDGSLPPAAMDTAGPIANANIVAPHNPGTPQTTSASSGVSLDEIRTDLEAEEFLKTVRINSFYDVLKSSKGFSNQTGILENLNGSFKGVANITDGAKLEKWDVTFHLNGQMQTGKSPKFEGSLRVVMAKNGKVFSNKRGSGSINRDVRELPTDERTVLFEVAPDTYFQAYFVKGMDSLIANVIEAEGDAPYRTIGTVTLRRE